jgi:hypothetical protein
VTVSVIHLTSLRNNHLKKDGQRSQQEVHERYRRRDEVQSNLSLDIFKAGSRMAAAFLSEGK